MDVVRLNNGLGFLSQVINLTKLASLLPMLKHMARRRLHPHQHLSLVLHYNQAPPAQVAAMTLPPHSTTCLVLHSLRLLCTTHSPLRHQGRSSILQTLTKHTNLYSTSNLSTPTTSATIRSHPLRLRVDIRSTTTCRLNSTSNSNSSRSPTNSMLVVIHTKCMAKSIDQQKRSMPSTTENQIGRVRILVNHRTSGKRGRRRSRREEGVF